MEPRTPWLLLLMMTMMILSLRDKCITITTVVVAQNFIQSRSEHTIASCFLSTSLLHINIPQILPTFWLSLPEPWVQGKYVGSDVSPLLSWQNFLDHWAFVVDVGPSPVVLDHCRRPDSNNNGHIRYCLIVDVVADIYAVILAIVIIIVIVIEQQHILHAHQPLWAPPQWRLQHPDQPLVLAPSPVINASAVAKRIMDMSPRIATWKKGRTIKTEPRILIFRRNTQYYNSVWAVDW
jgi:hypothetical protein